MTAEQDKMRVRIHVADETDARKITAMLERLGYEVVRELGEETGQARLSWAVARLALQAQLTERESDILARVLMGRASQEIASDLELSRATVKWHLHNVFAKTGTRNREELLRFALQLGNESRQPSTTNKPEAGQADTGENRNSDQPTHFTLGGDENG